MRLAPAIVDRLWNSPTPPAAPNARKRLALLAACLVWFAASPAHAQTVSVTGISATPNCDAVTGISLSAAGSVSIADGNGTLIAVVGVGTLHPVRAAEQQRDVDGERSDALRHYSINFRAAVRASLAVRFAG